MNFVPSIPRKIGAMNANSKWKSIAYGELKSLAHGRPKCMEVLARAVWSTRNLLIIVSTIRYHFIFRISKNLVKKDLSVPNKQTGPASSASKGCLLHSPYLFSPWPWPWPYSLSPFARRVRPSKIVSLLLNTTLRKQGLLCFVRIW